MILRKFQQAGHHPIVLIGGGTTKVGDPSGKDTSRQMLSEHSINENVASISKVRLLFVQQFILCFILNLLYFVFVLLYL